LGLARFVAVCAGVILLHATWDRLASDDGHLGVGGVSFILLMAVNWYLHRRDVA
jgi:hypothetical protein